MSNVNSECLQGCANSLKFGCSGKLLLLAGPHRVPIYEDAPMLAVGNSLEDINSHLWELDAFYQRLVERRAAKKRCRKITGTVKSRRQAREVAAGNGWSENDWNALVIRHDGCCLRCGSDEKPLVPDHVVPLCKGGAHTIANIQPLCAPCNIWKGIRIVDFRHG